MSDVEILAAWYVAVLALGFVWVAVESRRPGPKRRDVPRQHGAVGQQARRRVQANVELCSKPAIRDVGRVLGRGPGPIEVRRGW